MDSNNPRGGDKGHSAAVAFYMTGNKKAQAFAAIANHSQYSPAG